MFKNKGIIFYFFLLITITFSLSFSINSYSQKQTTIDSLSKLLNTVKDSTRVAVLKQISWEYRNSDTTKAVSFGKTALKNAIDKNLKFEQADILGRLGIYQRNLGNFSKAMDFYFKGLDLAEKCNFLKLEALEYNNIGDIYNRLGVYDQALEYVNKALKISTQLNDKYNLSYIYHMLGLIYMNSSEDDSALVSFRKSLEYRKQLKLKTGIASSYLNIGLIHFKKGSYDSSLIYYNRSLAIFKLMNDYVGIANIYKCLGEYDNQKKDYNGAIENFKKSMILIKGFGIPQVNKDAAEGLKLSYSKLGEFKKALYFQEFATNIKDSITNNIYIQKITRLTENYKYEIKNKEQEIITKQKEEILNERISNQRTQLNILIVGFLLMVVLIGIIVFFYRDKNQAYKALNLKTKEIAELNTGLTIANTEIKSQKEEIEAQRDALQKQSDNLSNLNFTKDKLFSIIGHDLRSPFTSIIGFSNYIKENVNKSSIDEIVEMNEQINEVGINTLGILENLLNWAKTQTHQVNVSKEKISIITVISENIKTFFPHANNKRVKLHYESIDEFYVIADANMLNTVIRNLISNSIKYSNPGGEIKVSAKSFIDHAEISIQDNGIGMGKELISNLLISDINHSTLGTFNEKGTGIGLTICKEFIKKLDGEFWIESEIGKGSTFRFTLPLG